MSHLTVTPLSTALGAQISGVDITQALNLEQRDAIERALLQHSVLFFRDQPITPQQQARFAANFGDLHIHPIYPNVPEQPEVLVLDTAVTDVRDNAIWHTDVTFLPTPALARCSAPSCCRPLAVTLCGPAVLRPTRHCRNR
jgi:taurine dioxygenase